MNSDLSNVKVGDEVLMVGYRRSGELRKVDRATKTQLTVANVCFNRNNGFRRGGSHWDTLRIYVPNDDEAEAARNEKRKRDLVYAISTACERDKLRKISLYDLEVLWQHVQDSEAEDE